MARERLCCLAAEIDGNLANRDVATTGLQEGGGYFPLSKGDGAAAGCALFLRTRHCLTPARGLLPP